MTKRPGRRRYNLVWVIGRPMTIELQRLSMTDEAGSHSIALSIAACR